ncbi:MAG: pilus assembly protein CpaE [Chloroflexi bacterium]|nr:MAG: pilus assembly protein CpaE [Chloroflexota bacterium]
MISLSLAKQLKKAGLVWKTSVNDFFGIPDRGFDDRVFVLSDMMANMDLFRGWPVVTFHGSAEWALDYILTSETVWLPTEEQLRYELEQLLLGEEEIKLQLTYTATGYQCHILHKSEPLSFMGSNGSEAYGLALLHVLNHLSQ